MSALPANPLVELLEPYAGPETLYVVVLFRAPVHRFSNDPTRYGLARYGVVEHDVVAASLDLPALLAWAAAQGHRVRE